MAPLPGLHLLLDTIMITPYTESPYTSVHVLIENTLVQHKMAKNSRMGCVARIECLKAPTSVMGFMIVPVSLYIVPRLRC